MLNQALEIKAKGNDLFKQKKYEEAIALYEDALLVCPVDRTDDLAALHHNIAACLENTVCVCVLYYCHTYYLCIQFYYRFSLLKEKMRGYSCYNIFCMSCVYRLCD